MFRHSLSLSKGQKAGRDTVYKHSGPLYKGQREGGRQ